MMTDERKSSTKTPHSLILENRKLLTATGVSNVDSFDEDTIIAYTDLGEIVIKGKGLHISKLNLETGEMNLDGEINSVSYSENQSYLTSCPFHCDVNVQSILRFDMVDCKR